MRRLILSLICGVAGISAIFALYQANTEVKSLKDQVAREAALLAESERRSVEQALDSGSVQELRTLVGNSAGVGVFDAEGSPLATAQGLDSTPARAVVAKSLKAGDAVGEFMRIKGAPAYVYALPLPPKGRLRGKRRAQLQSFGRRRGLPRPSGGTRLPARLKPC